MYKERALKKLRKDLRTGIYALIVLAILRSGIMHGYAIRKKFEELSDGKIVPSEGTLYDLLKSLEKLKLVRSFWGESGGRIRRYYEITDLGLEVLDELRKEFSELVKILEGLV